MSSLTLLLIVFSNFAWSHPWPRLINYLPARNCRAQLDPVDDVVSELTSLLDLSHPLLQRYLALHTREREKADQAFHVDLRTLALIYGDQPDLDLRQRDAKPAFDKWQDDLRGWAWRTDAHRAEVASRFVIHLADLDWGYDVTIPGSTVYLKGFNVTRAFRSDVHLFWNSMIGRHWDVDDKENVARRLHQRIERLRGFLAADRRVRDRLEARLTARFGRGNLKNVTARVRAFASAYRDYLDSQPDPARELGRAYAKRIFKWL